MVRKIGTISLGAAALWLRLGCAWECHGLPTTDKPTTKNVGVEKVKARVRKKNYFWRPKRAPTGLTSLVTDSLLILREKCSDHAERGSLAGPVARISHHLVSHIFCTIAHGKRLYEKPIRHDSPGNQE